MRRIALIWAGCALPLLGGCATTRGNVDPWEKTNRVFYQLGDDLDRVVFTPVNSTIGIAGTFDVASKWHLPKHENDFGITLGKWGVAPGPYLVLPLLGPASLRDTPGIVVANATNPVTWLAPPLHVTAPPLGFGQALDRRSRVDSAIRVRDTLAIDPYVFTRTAYLQYRQSAIHEGKPPVDQSLYNEDEPETTPASQPATTQAVSRPNR